MNHATITPTDNGPYMIEGPARIIDADGNDYDLTGQTTTFLCRCGNSGTKPFCDGTHETLNFKATSRAPQSLSAMASIDRMSPAVQTAP